MESIGDIAAVTVHIKRFVKIELPWPNILKPYGESVTVLRCKERIEALQTINTRKSRFCYVVIYDKILPKILP